MAQVRDYNKLAHDIIREVGGAQNIVNATRCATRFRLARLVFRLYMFLDQFSMVEYRSFAFFPTNNSTHPA